MTAIEHWSRAGEEPDPRWSLANERTFLAYNRTALALIVAGLAITGSKSVAGTSAWFAAIGLPLVVAGGLVARLSRRRFIVVQTAMRLGEPLPIPGAAFWLARGVAATALAALVVAASLLA